MQTVNFNCSFCGKLMAVGTNLLGRNVRCPHCKQVLQAPATAGSAVLPGPPPAKDRAFDQPTVNTSPLESPESIFGEVHDEDLFGTRLPKVSLPSPTAKTEVNITVPVTETDDRARPASLPESRQAPSVSTNETTVEAVPEFPQLGNPWANAPVADAHARDDTAPVQLKYSDESKPARSSYGSRQPVQESGGGGALVWILLTYSALATGAVAYLFFTKTEGGNNNAQTGETSGQHPYTAIPDLFGQYPVADRKKLVQVDGMPAADLPVPPKLQVPLGQTLTIGDLEIKPLRVLSRNVTRHSKEAGRNDYTQRQTPGEVLLLYLQLKNTSDDVTFCPTDPACNSKFPRGTPIKPYTGFVLGQGDFLGGPFQWPDPQYERQYIDGQEKDDEPLGPKQEREYVIASVLEGVDIVRELASLKPDRKAIWRVQLRRGLYAWKDKEGHDQETSAYCVIGVPISISDVK
jgi:phage FluMu protein Com